MEAFSIKINIEGSFHLSLVSIAFWLSLVYSLVSVCWLNRSFLLFLSWLRKIRSFPLFLFFLCYIYIASPWLLLSLSLCLCFYFWNPFFTGLFGRRTASHEKFTGSMKSSPRVKLMERGSAGSTRALISDLHLLSERKECKRIRNPMRPVLPSYFLLPLLYFLYFVTDFFLTRPPLLGDKAVFEEFWISYIATEKFVTYRYWQWGSCRK